MSSFSSRLRELRIKADLSRKALAQKVGISKSSINMYERGDREPGIATLEALADCFDVDVDYLVGRSAKNTKAMTMNEKMLGEIIKEYRMSHGKMSTRAFGSLAGLSSGYISMLESGKNPASGKEIIPTIKTVAACAKAMGLTLQELLQKMDKRQKKALGLSEELESAFVSENVLPLQHGESMTLGQFVSEWRKKNGVTVRELAERAGLTSGYISIVENERSYRTGRPVVPSIVTMRKLAQGMGMSIDELLANLDGRQRISLVPENALPLPHTVKHPLLGNIACGEPITATENVDEMVDVAEDIHCDFVLRCKGDSMIGARIHDGDLVYIREQPDVENGQIAAVLIDGSETEATLKRVYKSGNTISLNPDNPNYQPIIFSSEDAGKVRILGLAVAFQSLL